MAPTMQSGLEMLLGRERYSALCTAARLTGSGVAALIRDAVDIHLDRLEQRGMATHDDAVVDLRGTGGRHRAPVPAPGPAVPES